jgi:predicted anti-sigma-YlaC factor YlaD
MRSCQEITRLVSEGLDRQLSWRERLALRMHLTMCSLCRAYRRQLLGLRHLFREGFREGPPAGVWPEERLSEEAKQRIKQRLSSSDSS